MSEQPNTPAAEAQPVVLLEDVIKALQKTFSRVNSETQQNKDKFPEKPTARVSGAVQFEAGLRVTPQGVDYLRVEPNGSIELKLKGEVESDIHYTPATQTPTEPKPNV